MKTVTLYRPSAVENALYTFDRYIEPFFSQNPVSYAARMFSRLPAVDLRESGDAYFLEAELPGYDEQSLEVQVNGGTLTIESKKKEEAPADSQSAEPVSAYVLRERRQAAFSRSFKLPENADPNQIAAHFKNGVLSLEIKKRAEAQKRTISIEKR